MRDFSSDPYIRKITIGKNRPKGTGVLYVSNPWHEAANASIKGLKYNQVSEGGALSWVPLKNLYNFFGIII